MKITREEAIELFAQCELHSDGAMIPLHRLRAKSRELYGKADEQSMDRTVLEIYRILAKEALAIKS